MKLINSRTLLSLMICLYSLSLWSDPIDVNRARKVALQSGLLSGSAKTDIVASKRTRHTQAKDNLQLVCTLDGEEHQTASPLVYVFAPASQKGYIMVAADDAVSPIVGYSPDNSFNKTELPPQFAAFLKMLKQHVTTASAQASEPPVAVTATQVKTPIKPLLGDIRWGQDMPYNTKTPLLNGNATPTGCVATALGQIMYYHRYPLCGKGTTYYGFKNMFKTGKTVELGSEGNYQWDKMRPNYPTNATITDEEKNAVGLLLLEVGAACNMKYAVEESSSSGANALKALQKHFDYPTTRLVRRMNVSAEEWERIIYQELAEQRPVYLDGIAAELGHAFVCDGYENGFYHINWGWNGVANGYFNFSYLAPQIRGVGGAGKGAYVVDLQAIVGIAPPGKVAHPRSEYFLLAKALRKSETYNDYDPKVDIRGVRLEGYETIEVDFSLGIMKDGKLIAVGNPSAWSIQKDYTYNKIEVRLASQHIPEGGTFELLPIFSVRGKNDWKEIPVGRYFEQSLKVSRKNNKLTVEEKIAPVQLVSAVEKSFLLSGKDNKLTFRLTNNGTAAYSSFVSVHFGDKLLTANETVDPATVKGQTISIHLEPGESQEYVAEYVPTGGATECYASVTYDPTNGLSEKETIIPHTVLNAYRIDVKSADLYEARLTTEFSEPVYKVQQNMPLKALYRAVSQASGNYKGSFAHLQLFAVSKDGLDVKHKFKEQEILLEKGEDKEYDGGGAQYLEPGEYQLILTRNERSGRTIKYETMSKATLIVLPAPADHGTVTSISSVTSESQGLSTAIEHGLLSVRCEAGVSAIHVYSLSGQKVANGMSSMCDIGHLPKGVYVVKAETSQGVKTAKFIKAQ